MKLLPFLDIPIVDKKEPSAIERYEQLVEWAEGDRVKLSAAFLAFENSGDDPSDYLFQIGFIYDNCLVTNKEVIVQVGNQCKEYKQWKKAAKLLIDIERHLELYYRKVDCVPPWGSAKYRELEAEGRTPRILHGPHKGGNLKRDQKRKIILDASNEIIYGPLL